MTQGQPARSVNDKNSCQLLRLVNADVNLFVQTLSEFLQPYSLNAISDGPFCGNLEIFQLSELGIFQIGSNNTKTVSVSTHSALNCGWVIEIPLQGELNCSVSHGLFQPHNSAAVLRPGEPVQFSLGNRKHQVSLRTLMVSPVTLQHHAEKLSAGQWSGTDLQLPDQILLNTPEGESFLRYLSFLYQELERNSPAWRSPLVAAQFRDAALSMLLCAAHPELFSPTAAQHESCKPSYISRAEAYIRACVAHPISITDISNSVGVSSRSLFKGFRKYLNTTPMAYLKTRRLECARRELLEAEPSCTRIADIAMTWGFSNAGHFAAEYRQAFGELPSVTLKR